MICLVAVFAISARLVSMADFTKIISQSNKFIKEYCCTSWTWKWFCFLHFSKWIYNCLNRDWYGKNATGRTHSSRRQRSAKCAKANSKPTYRTLQWLSYDEWIQSVDFPQFLATKGNNICDCMFIFCTPVPFWKVVNFKKGRICSHWEQILSF